MGVEQKKTSASATDADEIRKIMSEIEDLEKDLGAPPKLRAVPKEGEGETSVDPDAGGLEEFRASGEEASMEETLGSMKEELNEASLLNQVSHQDEADGMIEEALAGQDGETSTQDYSETTGEEEMNHDHDEDEGTLTMSLTGNMKLRLKYAFGDQEVVVGFGDQELKVQLSDGTEFKIPVRKKGNLKAA